VDDAQDFFVTLTSSLRSRGDDLRATSEASFTVRLQGKTWRVALASDRVHFVVSSDTAALDKAAAALRMP
jgi:hypothetical protein